MLCHARIAGTINLCSSRAKQLKLHTVLKPLEIMSAGISMKQFESTVHMVLQRPISGGEMYGLDTQTGRTGYLGLGTKRGHTAIWIHSLGEQHA